MHDRNDNAYEHGHKQNGFAARSEPDNYERTKRDFRQGVQNDDIGLQHFAQGFAPPKEQGDSHAEYDCDCKSRQRFPKGSADMMPERAVTMKGGDRLCNARRGTHDKGIHPAHRRNKLPKSENEGENADSERPYEN